MKLKNIKISGILIPLYLFLCFTPLRGESSILLPENFSSVQAGRFIEILEDPSNALTAGDVVSESFNNKFKKSDSPEPNFGFNNITYWVRFRIINRQSHEVKLFIETAYPHMDMIELYSERGGKAELISRNGDILPFDNRSIKYRNFVVPVQIGKETENTFYMRFSGKCFKQLSLNIWSPEKFSGMLVNEQFAFGIYYGIIIVMILYNLFIFFFVRDSSYLYYVLYILMYGLVQMAYNGMAYQFLWPSFPGWHNISLPFLIGTAILTMMQFSRSFLRCRNYSVKLDNTILTVMGFSAFIILFSFSGFYLHAIKMAMVLMVISSMMIVSSGIYIMKKGYRPARFFVISWIAFMAGMLLIALNKLSFIPSVFITEYAIQIGSAIEVTLLSVALADRINDINREKKTAQLEQMKAQEKYKFIVEETNDIIFSLDGDFKVLTANRAIRNHLNRSPQDATGMNFIDMIYPGHNNDMVTRDIVRQKLQQFAADRKTISFKTEFQTSISSSEPKEMQVRMEYLSADGRGEILGKASVIEEDLLLKYFESEKQQFSFGNYLILAEDMTQRVTRNLAKYMPPLQIATTRIALREIIINAIEHGNLDITYEEKTEALMNDNYFSFLAERRRHPDYSSKKVSIVYSIEPDKAVFRISDEGGGFDYNDFVANKINKANEEMLEHGRGLSMAFNVFDSVEFNEKGNQVLLVKLFQ